MSKQLSSYTDMNFAVVVPMANEEAEFAPFVDSLSSVLDSIGAGSVYIVLDKVSKDNTRAMADELALRDKRFHVVFEPQNRNVVDAYLRGYREAYNRGHDFIIEMDAGLSHDPTALPHFLDHLINGVSCVFGSRFVPGGSMENAEFKRVFLSRFGTFLSNVLLGTKLRDMTSGYQGFTREVVDLFLRYGLLSTGHFYQTELRYLLRDFNCREIPIRYTTPSPLVSNDSVKNSLQLLFYYFRLRLKGKSPNLYHQE